MYVHAEASSDASNVLHDGDLTMFIRLGTDFKENYYEYEIPLKITAAETNDPDKIWPEANFLDLDLEKLINLKLARNASHQGITSLYSQKDEGTNNRLYVIGNPSLSI